MSAARRLPKHGTASTAGGSVLAFALLIVGMASSCSSSDDDSAAPTPITEQEVLDLVAPTSGASVASSNGLRDAIARTRQQAMARCLEHEHGFEGLPDFMPDHGRRFDFPDPEDLLANGFHVTLPSTTSADRDPDPDYVGTDAFNQAAAECDDEVAADRPFETLQADLQSSWFEVVAASSARAEEQRLWRDAADCLALRGYPRTTLDSELAFVESLNPFIAEPADLEDRRARELTAAHDYVDCAEPVWTARAADLADRQSDWLAVHNDDVAQLAELLRQNP